MAHSDPRHGKVTYRWCDHCNTLLLGQKCSICSSPGREFSVSRPGDFRPALTGSADQLRRLVEKHFRCGERLNGVAVFLNKVAGEDRVDEVIVQGRTIAVLRFDVQRQELLLDLKEDGALLLFKHAKKGIVKLKPLGGHLQGKNLAGDQVLEANGDFSAGDPLIALTGNLVCAASARVPSSQLRTAEKAVHIAGAANAEGAWEAGKSKARAFVEANIKHLKVMESKGVSDIKSFVSQQKLPVTLSFSGGKDSLACYGLAKKAVKDLTLVFVNTGLEFPETVRYVHEFALAHGNKLLEANAGSVFWEQVEAFGPPAKDFRWCCKVCKLAPLTDIIERTYAEGTITIEGNRALESFARSGMEFVERNPFVPNQVVLNPIRGWIAADVWAYIWWKGLEYNPLYEQDFERIGCYLCPSCLASEWRTTKDIHPDLHRQWTEHLRAWAKEGGVSDDFIRFGFWRWKVLPAKMRLLAENLKLQVPKQRADRLKLTMVKGISPCITGGYSIEGVIAVPRRRPFLRVAEVLKTVGKTRCSEEFEIALTKGNEATIKVFGGGQVVATGATPEKAANAFEAGVKAFLRAELCTMCGICVKNCKRRAITLKDGPLVDEGLCSQCGKCTEACVVAHYYDKLVT